MTGKCSQPTSPPPPAPLGGLSLAAAGAPWACLTLAETRMLLTGEVMQERRRREGC